MTTVSGAEPSGAAARFVGTRMPRVEDERLLTGHGTFVADVVLPRTLHCCFVRSPYPRARILGIDVSEAISLPGVTAVFTAEELNPGVREQWHTVSGPTAIEVPRPPLAVGEVRFVGDPVALVVAEDAYRAEDGADLVVVDYEPLPAAVDYKAAENAEGIVHGAFPSNVVGQMAGASVDEVATALASGAHRVTAEISQHAHVPAPIETRGMVVDWRNGELTIYAATQSPHEYRMFCSRLLGLPEHRIRVIMRDTGGGFGQKIFVQREEMCLMLAAPKVPAPIKWIEDRRENLLAAGQSRHEHGTAHMAFDDEGHILAARLDVVQDVGAYPTPGPVASGALVGSLFPGPYRVPRATFTSKSVCSNTVGRAPYRGPWMFETLAREMLLDIAARQMGLDPIDLRRVNLLNGADAPYTNPNGTTYESVSPLETFELGVSMLGYEEFRRQQAAAREHGRYLGVGTSTYVELTTGGFGMYATEGATIRIEPSGKVNVYVAGGSTGNSLETTVVQLTADALGVDCDDVHTIQGDTAVTPYGAGTGGSRSGSMIAGAIGETAEGLRDKIMTIAAHRLEAAVEDIELAHSRAFVRGTPALGLSLSEVAQMAYFAVDQLPEGMPAGLEASGRYTTPRPFVWTNATHICTCEVDVTTGVVTLLRYIVSEDCGPMINPNVVEGQIAGGTVQGIGGVLHEHLAYDPAGNPIATTFMDYLLPTAADVPVIEYGHIETPSGGAGGFKGVGEGGAIGAPAAVVNAVADALSPFGVTITKLPLGPGDIVELLAGSRPR